MSDPNPEPRPVATNETSGAPNNREVGYGIPEPLPALDENATGRLSFASLFFEDFLHSNLATRIVGVAALVMIVACAFYVGGGLMEERKLRESVQQEEDVTPATVEPPAGVPSPPLHTDIHQASELKREIRLLEDQLDLDQVNSLLISPAFSKLPESASIEELLERREALRSLQGRLLELERERAQNPSPILQRRREARQRAGMEKEEPTTSPSTDSTVPANQNAGKEN